MYRNGLQHICILTHISSRTPVGVISTLQQQSSIRYLVCSYNGCCHLDDHPHTTGTFVRSSSRDSRSGGLPAHRQTLPRLLLQCYPQTCKLWQEPPLLHIINTKAAENSHWACDPQTLQIVHEEAMPILYTTSIFGFEKVFVCCMGGL